MRAILAAGFIVAMACGAARAVGGEGPSRTDYRDDRSSGSAVVESYYNAIDRREYARAYSYFIGGAPEVGAAELDRRYARFRAGFEHTAHVWVRTGKAFADTGAGTTMIGVPTVIRALDDKGRSQLYVGCYHLRQVSAAAQDRVPFRPIYILDGRMARATGDFASVAMPDCAF